MFGVVNRFKLFLLPTQKKKTRFVYLKWNKTMGNGRYQALNLNFTIWKRSIKGKCDQWIAPLSVQKWIFWVWSKNFCFLDWDFCFKVLTKTVKHVVMGLQWLRKHKFFRTCFFIFLGLTEPRLRPVHAMVSLGPADLLV